jgi:hypothetical protein
VITRKRTLWTPPRGRSIALLAVALLTSVAVLTAGCSGAEPDDTAAAPADTITQSARDSAVARSGLPGARGINRAQDAAAAAAERAAQIDTLR